MSLIVKFVLLTCQFLNLLYQESNKSLRVNLNTLMTEID